MGVFKTSSKLWSAVVIALIALAPVADAAACTQFVGPLTADYTDITTPLLGKISVTLTPADFTVTALTTLLNAAGVTGLTGSTTTPVDTLSRITGYSAPTTASCDVWAGPNFILVFKQTSNVWMLLGSKFVATALGGLGTSASLNPCTSAIPTSPTAGYILQSPAVTPNFARYGATGLDAPALSWTDFATTTVNAIAFSGSTAGTTPNSFLTCAVSGPTPSPPPPAPPSPPFLAMGSSAVSDPSWYSSLVHRYFNKLAGTAASFPVVVTDFVTGAYKMDLAASAPGATAVTTPVGSSFSLQGFNGTFTSTGTLFPTALGGTSVVGVFVWVGLPVVATTTTGTTPVTTYSAATGTSGAILFSYSVGPVTYSLVISPVTATSPWGNLVLTIPNCAPANLIAPPGMPHSSANYGAGGRNLYAITIDRFEGVMVFVNGIPYGVDNTPNRGNSACSYGAGGLIPTQPGVLSFSTTPNGRYLFLDYAVVQATSTVITPLAVAALAATVTTANSANVIYSTPPPPMVSGNPVPITACTSAPGSLDLRFIAGGNTLVTNFIPFTGSLLIETNQVAITSAVAFSTVSLASAALFSSPTGLPTMGQPFLPSPGTVSFGKLLQSSATAPIITRLLAVGMLMNPSDFITLDIGNFLVTLTNNSVSATNMYSGDFATSAMNPYAIIRPGNAYITIVTVPAATTGGYSTGITYATASPAAVLVFVGRSLVWRTPVAWSSTASQVSGGIPAYLSFSGVSIYDIQIYRTTAVSVGAISDLGTGNSVTCS